MDTIFVSKWFPIESAPKDGTRVLVAGRWDERAAEHCRGQTHLCIGSWSSWSSSGDPKDSHWIYEGALGNTKPEGIAVTFDKWMHLPDAPA